MGFSTVFPRPTAVAYRVLRLKSRVIAVAVGDGGQRAGLSQGNDCQLGPSDAGLLAGL